MRSSEPADPSEARFKATRCGLGHDRKKLQPVAGHRRHASTLAGIDPRVYRRRPSRPEETELRDRLKELSGERRRIGYRRLHLLLGREGWQVNWKKIYRIYREEGLTVRKRGGRKRAIGTRAPMAIPQGPNQRWSLDFVSDSLSDGRRFRVLCVIDDFSRE
ncbi:helix-turn-helix protein, partial [Ruegeria sp. P4]